MIILSVKWVIRIKLLIRDIIQRMRDSGEDEQIGLKIKKKEALLFLRHQGQKKELRRIFWWCRCLKMEISEILEICKVFFSKLGENGLLREVRFFYIKMNIISPAIKRIRRFRYNLSIRLNDVLRLKKFETWFHNIQSEIIRTVEKGSRGWLKKQKRGGDTRSY